MDSKQTVLEFCKTMTWNGENPHVELVQEEYKKGVKLSKRDMDVVESVIERKDRIGKWIVVIKPTKCRDFEISLRT